MNNPPTIIIQFPRKNPSVSISFPRLSRSIPPLNALLYKAQSTISICALLLFTILLIFTVSTLPSTTPAAARDRPRRHLNGISSSSRHALQGMGTLYRRGTRAMNNLIVAHAVESLTLLELKLFLRVLHRSGTTSKSDLLFVFASKSEVFDAAIREENDYFMRLVNEYGKNVNSSYRSSFLSFQWTHFVKKWKQTGEPIWGGRIREENGGGWSYGSVVGFDAEELDPEKSLSGFSDQIPMSLRRWACYPMLLGRVRRNFKHVTLVDMKEVLLLDDPFNKIVGSSESVVLMKQGGRKVSPAVIIGGGRGVRRLSNIMLTEIVRTWIQKKRKNWAATDAALLNQLVGNPFLLLNNVDLILIPDLASAVTSSNFNGILRRGNANLLELDSILCSFPLDSTVYSDCEVTHVRGYEGVDPQFDTIARQYHDILKVFMETKLAPECVCGRGPVVLHRAGQFSTRPEKLYYICPASINHPNEFFWYNEYHHNNNLRNNYSGVENQRESGTTSAHSCTNRKSVYAPKPRKQQFTSNISSSIFNMEHNSTTTQSKAPQSMQCTSAETPVEVMKSTSISIEHVCCCFGCTSLLISLLLFFVLCIIMLR